MRGGSRPPPPRTRRGGPELMKALFCMAALAAALGLAGCGSAPIGVYQGYIEGEYVYVAAPLAGTLSRLAVSRGQEVAGGQPLFELEREAEAAAEGDARHRLDQARARLANLTKGRRPSEIASIEAQLKRAEATLKLSELELERRVRLDQNKVISAAELDLARSRREADQAQVASLAADLETARLGAREDEVKAAEAEVAAAQAALTRAQWAVSQKSQSAPTNAWVHDTLYRQGEFVAAGSPVVSLLPPTNLKVRFFVPQAQLSGLQPGRSVWVTMDGPLPALSARISYISTQAEFTPPVIYSQETRAKLVFMIEAVFAPGDAPKLKPGQPAEVRLAP
jgi:HlyD family secretion protein